MHRKILTAVTGASVTVATVIFTNPTLAILATYRPKITR